MKLDPEHLPRIANKDLTQLGGPSRRQPVRDPAPSDAAGSGAAKGDGLVLSPQADRFRQLRARLQSLPESRQTEKVAKLKALVASGQFKVDGEQVADAMLSDEATVAALGLGSSESSGSSG